VPQTYPAPSQRGTGPSASQTYVTGTGAAVCISCGPNDGYSPVSICVQLLPSASWKAALPFIGRINTYYASSKDVSVLAAMGINTSALDAATAAPSSLFGMSGTAFWYHVLPADLNAEVTALTALVTSGNIAKGGNP
jgi:hypothetical protein